MIAASRNREAAPREPLARRASTNARPWVPRRQHRVADGIHWCASYRLVSLSHDAETSNGAKVSRAPCPTVGERALQVVHHPRRRFHRLRYGVPAARRPARATRSHRIFTRCARIDASLRCNSIWDEGIRTRSRMASTRCPDAPISDEGVGGGERDEHSISYR